MDPIKNIEPGAKTDPVLLAAIVESSGDAIIGVTFGGLVVSWNRGAENLYKYKSGEIVGKSILTIIPKDRIGELEDAIAKTKKGELVAHSESIRVCKDGSMVTVSVGISPILDQTGKIVGMSSISQNVVGSKKTIDYARSLIEASHESLIAISPEGKITDLNEATVKVTGVSRENIINTDFSSYFTEPEVARRGYEEAIKSGSISDYPVTMKSKDGKLIDVLYTASVYKDESGNVIGVIAAARDVTAAKQALFYARSVIEAGLDPMITISPEGKITDVNEAMVSITGVKREQLVGSEFVNYFDDKEETTLGYKQVFKEGFVREYPLVIRNISGALTDVLFNASIYKDDKGVVFGAIAAVRDISAQKVIEDKLHETSAYARSLIEASLDPLFIINPEGKITGVNGATEKVTGITREWLIDTDFSAYFTEPHKAQAGYRQVLKEGEVKDFPLSIHNATGIDIDVSFNASVYKDATGEVRGIFAVARDVTGAKKVSEYSRSLFEVNQDPLVAISPEGKLTDVNEAVVRVTGVSRESLIGTDFANYFTEPEKAKEGYKKAFKEGLVTDYPLTIKSVDGKLTDVLYNASVYKADGKVVGLFAAARDYTVAKKAKEEAAAASKEMESFSYSVSHDLRAPLRAIDGFSQMLVEGYEDKLDEEGKRMISVIRASTVQMAKLIDDLLSFSRLSRSEMKKERVATNILVNEIYTDLKKTVPERNIELLMSDLPDCKGDINMLKVVWTNLLSNAIKYTGKKEKAEIEVGSKVDEKDITFFVKDNGAGFEMKYVDKLFGVFQRLHSTEEFEGTGIGLANVKRVVEKHGGKVWAAGKVDEGATFYFSLPKD